MHSAGCIYTHQGINTHSTIKAIDRNETISYYPKFPMLLTDARHDTDMSTLIII
jgi:hypothetical protein